MLTNLHATMATAHSSAVTTQEAINDVLGQIGDVDAAAVLVFADARYDIAKMTATFEDHWPEAEVVAATTAGEFDNHHVGHDGMVVVALPSSRVRRARAELAGFRKGVESGVQGVLRRLERGLFCHLEDLDPERCVGIVLFDGTHGDEEQFHRGLMRLAPMLTFVGGTAADGMDFDQTRISVNGRETDHGAAVLILEMDAPFAVFQTTSFIPTSTRFTVTQSDVARRVVYEVDGRTLPHAYAEALGLTVGDLDRDVFARHPLGAMINGEPWIRSPQGLHLGGGLRFQGQIREGTHLFVMEPTDLIADTAAAVAEARARLGGSSSGGLLFDDAFRQAHLVAEGATERWRDMLGTSPIAGFGGYGQSLSGHHNQTGTGLLFG